jgi:AAA family ATP:ADP antiporter
LFTILTRQEKYKAKLAIDAVVQRMGDTVAAAVFEVGMVMTCDRCDTRV